MNTANPAGRIEGMSLRQAALTAGIAYLLMPVSFAEFYIFPRLLVAGDAAQTAQNIAAHGQLFFIAVLCHFITLLLDIVIAWALYVLLAPVNRALSLFTAWLRLAYAAIGLAGVDKLLAALRAVNTPYYHTLLGEQQLQAQVMLWIGEFRHSLNLGLFGIHLILLGYLIFRSGYIPRLLGVILAIVGAGWVTFVVQPYLFPNVSVSCIVYIGAAELLLPLWLVIRGWKIREPGH
ncbi:MAG TPA: DUF4386 domain-containing protein [Gammaproteobacteria bacterium]|nr:DUF4386 domain-containing protein [Gammaproteobacteria bacterium]